MPASVFRAIAAAVISWRSHGVIAEHVDICFAVAGKR